MTEIVVPSLTPSAPEAIGRFDRSQADEFAQRSTSEETRRAYKRVVREFFAAAGNLHPQAIEPTHVREWRDHLLRRRQKATTVSFKLAVVRAFFAYLKELGLIERNPADTKFVPSPQLPEEMAGRALTPEEVRKVLAGPDRSQPAGARDHALLQAMLRLGLRVAEVCSLKASAIKWSQGRWIVKVKVKGGRGRTLPLPEEVRTAIKEHIKLDEKRRLHLHSGGTDAFIFQPLVNYRTLEFNKPLSIRMVWNIVVRWGNWGRVGKLSPHDLRRTAITRALDQGLSYRQVQMMSGHRDPKTVMRYDQHRENLDQNAANHLHYE